MPGFVDIAPVVETIEIRKQTIEVTGLTPKGVGRVIWRFPEVRKMIETRKFDIEALIDLSDEALAAVIAAGVGCPGDLEQERQAKNLTLEEKLLVLGAIAKVTMPNGPGPFVDAVSALMGGLAGGSAAALVSTSPSPSRRSSKRAT